MLLQSKPFNSFPTTNMIADPGKRLGHDTPCSDTKSHASQALMESNSSGMMTLTFTHEINPSGCIDENALDISDRCHHDLPRKVPRTCRLSRQKDPRFLRYLPY